MGKKRKAVFLLGAGFSAPAKIPTQEALLSRIRGLRSEDSEIVDRFVKDFFNHRGNVPLEDIFTALDKSISEDQSLREYDTTALWKVRFSLNKCLSKVLAASNIIRPKYVEDFARVILDIRMKEHLSDKVAILSTNWDMLLDSTLGRLMPDPYYFRVINEKEQRALYIDYCISDEQLDKRAKIRRSLLIKGLGYFNVKLVKLHGSINWLKCPSCQYLYVGYGNELDEWIAGKTKYCRECNKRKGDRIPLRPFLISPTFLKDLDNVHSQTSWWSAGIELREASDLYIIGYSLPLADFELRYLLARNVSIAVSRIKVILKSHNRHKYKDTLEKERYVDFFGRDISRNIEFHGVEHFTKLMREELSYL